MALRRDEPALLLLASDGVWDAMKPGDLVAYFRQSEAPTFLAKVEATLQHAAQRANKLFGETERDDCTLVVLQT